MTIKDFLEKDNSSENELYSIELYSIKNKNYVNLLGEIYFLLKINILI